MKTNGDQLLTDIRKVFGRAVEGTHNLDAADRGFAAWCMGLCALSGDAADLLNKIWESEVETYRDVAAMGFHARRTGLTVERKKRLSEGLVWLSSRPMSLVGA